MPRVRGGYYTTTEPGDWLAQHREEAAKLRRLEAQGQGVAAE